MAVRLPQNTSDNMIRIISLTDAGYQLAQRIQALIPRSTCWHKPKPFTTQVQQAFQQGDALIMICATGIAVRTLAPVLQSKLQDPPVLILDEMGQFVIPLLSGHEGGANDWAYQLAEQLNAQLVMTTAKKYIEPIYTLGMGCERGCPKEHLYDLATQCLTQQGLQWDNIHSIHSIALKQDEVGLIQLAQSLKKPFLTWSAQQLHTMDQQLSTRSDYVFKVTGVYGVAESSALYGAHSQTHYESELVLNKQKTAKATCAIARSYPQ